MIKLLIHPVLREEGKMEGIVFTNEDHSLMLFPKGLKVHSRKGEYYPLAHNEAYSPEGSMGFLTALQAIRFLSEVVGDQVSCETGEEMRERLKDSNHVCLQGDWLDRLFLDSSRFNLTEAGNKAREALSQSDQSRYAKTGKGKQSQRKWRQSEGGQAYLQATKERRKELNSNFREAQAWLDANPGHTFEDWLVATGRQRTGG